MAALFDLRSVFLVGACTAALGCATFIALQPMYRRTASPLRRYAVAMAAMAAGLALLSFRGATPEWLNHVGTNSLVSIGIVVLADATMRLFDRRQPDWLLAAQIAGMVLLWSWLGDDPEDGTTRMVSMSAVQLTWSGAIACMIARSHAYGRQRYVGALAWTFYAYACAHLLRGAMALADDPARGGALVAGTGSLVFVLVFALSPIALALVIQMILHARVSGELLRRATTDELTGLYTRGRFFDLSRERLRKASADDGVHHLLMIDLDHFKSVNDRYGHSVGDRALRHAARVLRDAMSSSGLLARYGGEEFCALIRSPDHDVARRTIDELRTALEAAPLRAGRATIPLTASIGAVPIVDAESLERVLVHADHCVYRAKTEGRNRVVRFGETLAEPVV